MVVVDLEPVLAVGSPEVDVDLDEEVDVVVALLVDVAGSVVDVVGVRVVEGCVVVVCTGRTGTTGSDDRGWGRTMM